MVQKEEVRKQKYGGEGWVKSLPTSSCTYPRTMTVHYCRIAGWMLRCVNHAEKAYGRISALTQKH
jgi:hypothetical protein